MRNSYGTKIKLGLIELSKHKMKEILIVGYVNKGFDMCTEIK
jgi:hypothetical protein